MDLNHFTMRSPRAFIAADPRLFGRGPSRVEDFSSESEWTLGSDAKLFVATFAAGFLFVSILIA